jgi:hypothetical protein
MYAAVTFVKAGVRCEIRTRVNKREALFRRRKALKMFDRVFGETKLRFVFEIRLYSLADDRLTFLIKPADGMGLPAIMKWQKPSVRPRGQPCGRQDRAYPGCQVLVTDRGGGGPPGEAGETGSRG